MSRGIDIPDCGFGTCVTVRDPCNSAAKTIVMFSSLALRLLLA